jgi:hypothetical protein
MLPSPSLGRRRLTEEAVLGKLTDATKFELSRPGYPRSDRFRTTGLPPMVRLVIHAANAESR